MSSRRALTRLTAARPALVAEVEAVLGGGSAPLRTRERAVAAYLADEQRRHRIPAGVDVESLALTVAGAVQHVALTDDPASAAARRLRPAMDAIAGTWPAARP